MKYKTIITQIIMYEADANDKTQGTTKKIAELTIKNEKQILDKSLNTRI